MRITCAAPDEAPRIHHRRVGDVLVTILSDGYLDAPLDVVRNVPPAEAQAVIRRQSGRVPPNTFAVRSAGRVALIDTGSGDSMGPTLGRLPQALAAAGIAADAIDTILLTHMHPDHSNGLSDAAGRRCFPNAAVAMHENELPHLHLHFPGFARMTSQGGRFALMAET